MALSLMEQLTENEITITRNQTGMVSTSACTYKGKTNDTMGVLNFRMTTSAAISADNAWHTIGKIDVTPAIDYVHTLGISSNGASLCCVRINSSNGNIDVNALTNLASGTIIIAEICFAV